MLKRFLVAWALLLPASGNDLYARIARLAPKFVFSGLAPGDYLAYAWTGSPAALEYANPDARQTWACQPVSVHIEAHGRQAVALKVAPGEAP